MNNLILLVVVVALAYILAGYIQRKPYSFKFLGKSVLSQGNISADRINEILLQENHGKDIDTVVDNVKKNNPSLPFMLKD